MSQPIHTYIEISGVKLEVIGTYYPGEAASMDCPGEEESIEIISVLTPKGDDIGGLLGHCSELASDIEAMALELHATNRAERSLYLQEEAAIARREMAREAA